MDNGARRARRLLTSLKWCMPIAAALIPVMLVVSLPRLYLFALLISIGLQATLWRLNTRSNNRPTLAGNGSSKIAELYANLKSSHDELEKRNVKMNEQAEQMAAMNARLREMQSSLEASYQHLAQINGQLEEKATSDAMTGLANHRSFQERLREELAQACRQRQPLALLMLDVDHFKAYNDSYGHPAGDEVLRLIGSLLKAGTRIGDVVARYGGEEFAVILPATDLFTAEAVAARIRGMVEAHAFSHRSMTVSVGVAAANLDSQNAEALVSETDEALYLAKSQGRNRVCVSDSVSEGESGGWSEMDTTDLVHISSSTVTSGGNAGIAMSQDGFGGLEGLLQEACGPVLSSILAALDMRDHECVGHPQRVARYSLRLASAVGEVYERRRANEPLVPWLTPNDMRDLALGAMLHDIGNIRIPDHIIRKAGVLTPEETNLLRRHPRLGAEIVGGFAVIDHALAVIKYHHERWDGQGYPYGIAREEIPLVARVFSVCDALESMTTDQPYRKSLSFSAAREEIRLNAGKQFDPTVVEAFLDVPEDDWKRLQSGDKIRPWLANAA